MTYRIRTVSEMTGIPRNTLIAWERRYGFVRPERHDNSYRSYSEADVDKLKRIKEAIDGGLSVSEAIALLEDGVLPSKETTSKRQPLPLEPATEVGASAASESDPFRDIRSRLYEALTNYRGAQSERLLAALLGVAVDTRIHRVYFPILRQIGEDWEAGRVNVAQEHYAAAIIREQLVSILVGLARRSSPGPHAACTTFPGDQHELGAMAMSVRLSQTGYRVSHLGPNLPASELGEFCHSSKPSLVCVSAILEQQSSDVVDYARELRRSVPDGTRLVIGGRGIDLDPMPTTKGVELIPNWDGFSERENWSRS